MKTFLLWLLRKLGDSDTLVAAERKRCLRIVAAKRYTTMRSMTDNKGGGLDPKAQTPLRMFDDALAAISRH